nr:hypothetical protein [Vibrio parahaemolyticus]
MVTSKSRYSSCMNVKTILLTHIHRAKSDREKCLDELLDLMSQAVARTDLEEFDWYLMNDLVDADILFTIVLTDVDLTINFNEYVLIEAVRFVMTFGCELQH